MTQMDALNLEAENRKLKETLKYAYDNITIHQHDKFKVECHIALEARERIKEALEVKK